MKCFKCYFKTLHLIFGVEWNVVKTDIKMDIISEISFKSTCPFKKKLKSHIYCCRKEEN